MPRRFDGDRLVIASHNHGKVEEIAALLAPFAVDVVAAGALGLPEPEETGDSFEANAALKARAAAGASGLPALADDSGLVVPALGGAPGIYSARWAGPAKDFRLAMARVQRELAERRPQRLLCRGPGAGLARRRYRRRSAARSRAISSGRRAASAASATTRCSFPTAVP